MTIEWQESRLNACQLSGLAGETDLPARALAEAKRLQPNLTVHWVERCHPIVRVEDRAMYIEGPRKAGLE
jgi:hypothetical protein